MDEALDLLADAILQKRGADLGGDAELNAYYTKSFKAMLRLDSSVPEALEERVIVATRDNVSEIQTSISVPRKDGDNTMSHGIEIELLHGGRLETREQPFESYFRQVISLPAPLRRGDEHEYLIRTKLPKGQPLSPHYVHVPLRRSDLFSLRIKFNTSCLPENVWLLSGVPTAVIYERWPNAEKIEPDVFGEVRADFVNLRQGYGYGIRWS
ncbi:hypothetical protein ACIQUM_33955 [Amycolatopsis azurea]|uniref:hypothetical protein n=1 Tax=Amycolatopsis azurea TaxID=36819 RepID=UPI003822B137